VNNAPVAGLVDRRTDPRSAGLQVAFAMFQFQFIFNSNWIEIDAQKHCSLFFLGPRWRNTSVDHLRIPQISCTWNLCTLHVSSRQEKCSWNSAHLTTPPYRSSSLASDLRGSVEKWVLNSDVQQFCGQPSQGQGAYSYKSSDSKTQRHRPKAWRKKV